MITYNNKEILVDGCPGCAFGRHAFELDCGMAYENERFTLSQDWEVPIPGFFILAPKRHIEKLCELTEEERNEIFFLVNKTTQILRALGVCDRFDYIFEEKEKRHLHVWILPRHDWIMKMTDDIIGSINTIFDYAGANLKNEENYEAIKRITELVNAQMTI